MVTNIILGFLAIIVVLAWFGGVRVVNQIERGVVFRFGRVQKEVRQPGLTFLIPLVDRMTKVNTQIVTMPVPTQEGITRDNVSVRVDAVAYFKVQDPVRAAVGVQNYLFAVEQVAQTSLRSIIGKSDLDDLLSNREELNKGLALMIDSPALGWGIHIDRVEIKDVTLPETMKRSVARQAEAERERRARVITADGEFRAAQKLADASAIMASTPSALQLRLLQTVVEVAAEKTSTLVMPLPVELLRFFDRPAQDSSASATSEVPVQTETAAPRPEPSDELTAPQPASPDELTAPQPASPDELTAPRSTPHDELTELLGPRDAARRPGS
ncbi:slipin family protein [Nonomuraea sp. K274]|uniref:Slipin family protein n=1 Tax=Nonomuraea cypriaca TaxID=1187855 RepID=A0A931F1R4_9ACTN|nr:slipin family protein [Nonomuraea cypriaca]MBF8189877.1 slipin family protein [Nonomuraea cypriaca]